MLFLSASYIEVTKYNVPNIENLSELDYFVRIYLPKINSRRNPKPA